jgi:hypothetical protein
VKSLTPNIVLVKQKELCTSRNLQLKERTDPKCRREGGRGRRRR